MSLDIQFKIKSDPNYQKYIRENSNWYKLLNRNPLLFNDFVNEVKTNYRLRPSDRIERILTTVEMIQAVINNIKT